jgi:hypothetical protein
MIDTASLTIHYEGQRLKKHKMDLESFAVSLLAFNDLVFDISKELGIKKEELSIEISPLEVGGLKANLILSAIFFGSAIGTHVIENVWDGLHINQRIGLETLITKVNMFLDHKNNPDNGNNIIKLTNGLDAIDVRIMKNPTIHAEAETFTSVLGTKVDCIEIITDHDTKRTIPKENKKYFINPFPEFAEDLDGKIIEKKMILRLDGPRLIGSEWIFKVKSKNSSKEHIFRAEVLDSWLMELGRKKSLSELGEIDLLCIVREKIMKAGQKRATINRYIIKATLADESSDALL